MKKYFIFFIPILAVACLVATAQQTSAASLKLAPLEYRTTLARGEKQKGFVDLSNPTGSKLKITTSVQAFKQTDDQGSLYFYDSEELTAGVRLDLKEFELGPREAIRMYFELDSAKLPSGDVFGAIFLSTQPASPRAGVGQAVRLGTLLSIVNGTPGSREASITKLDVPFLQFDQSVRGVYTIKNTANPEANTGFYPTVSLRSALFGEAKDQQGKLIFAGKTRENEFVLKTPPIGIYRISAGYKDSIQSRYVLVLTPTAAAVVVILGLASVAIGKTVRRYTRPKTGMRLK